MLTFLFLFMEKNDLKNYLEQRLQELEKKKDMEDVTYKGKFSFGLPSKDYAHLPAWNSLKKQKSIMVRLVWIEGVFLSLTVVGMTSDIWDKFSENWWKALLAYILLSFVVLIFFILLTYFNLFTQFRQTEREIRKLIYQDILHKMEKEEA